jgi:hypothetical protein
MKLRRDLAFPSCFKKFHLAIVLFQHVLTLPTYQIQVPTPGALSVMSGGLAVPEFRLIRRFLLLKTDGAMSIAAKVNSTVRWLLNIIIAILCR